MSKYTTEVRFICESLSGLSESVGADDVDEVLSKSWNKIFTTKTKFFDDNYRSVLCKKILKHYYLREIGCETFGVWKLWVNTRLEEIMPYYNKLYESELLKFDPMRDVNLTREHKRTTEASSKEDSQSEDNITGNKTLTGDRTSDTTGSKTDTETKTVNETGESTNNTSGTSDTNRTTEGTNNTDSTNDKNVTNTSENTKKDLYSDTPQGALTGVESETYLTNARKVNDDAGFTQDEKTTHQQTDSTGGTEDTNLTYSENDSGNTTNTAKTDGTLKSENKDNTTSNYNENENTTETKTGSTSNTGSSNSTEDFIESIIGKQGTESYSSLLLKYRDTFLNIDMQVIDEFSDLFFNLW